MKVIVGAVISLPPFSAGMAWNWMQHVTGLRDLGHETLFVEEVDPAWWVDAAGRACAPRDSVNRQLFDRTMARFGLTGRAVQVERGTGRTFGMADDALREALADSDLLVNMSGHVQSGFLLDAVRRRAYVDQDPVYTQLWLAEHGHGPHVEAHDVFLTVGLDVGTRRTHIPSAGLEWRPVLPPVVLDQWPVTASPAANAPLTTIASWTGYADLLFDGEWYRSKHVEFARFASLPARTGRPFEAAIKSWREADPGIASLRAGGWSLTGTAELSDLDAYQRYLADSRGEIGIAKHAYVHGRSGWFSDRSAHYLASGRPVVAQATGFEAHLPTGEGLLGFSTVEDAVVAVRALDGDYDAHARAARRIAEEHLDHREVLPALLDACMEPVSRDTARAS